MKLQSMAVAALFALTGPALAQDGTPINVLGTVAALDAGSLTLKPDDGGAAQTFKLAPKMLVVQNKPATLADIKPDDFVASAAIRGPDHKLHSTELRIFPPADARCGRGPACHERRARADHDQRDRHGHRGGGTAATTSRSSSRVASPNSSWTRVCPSSGSILPILNWSNPA